MSDGAPSVLFEADRGLAILTLNRPERRNGMAGDMLDLLLGHLTRIATDPAISVVILRGAGSDFCVGADIKESPDGVRKQDYRRIAGLYHTSTLLHEMPKVTIAAIDGGCAGAGLGWAGACDFRFASDRAVFSTAFLKVGVAGDLGTAWSLVQAVGPARARELMFFPEKFGAAEAERIGLVQSVIPPQDLAGAVDALADAVLAHPPAAVRATRALLAAAAGRDRPEQLAAERSAQGDRLRALVREAPGG